MALDFRRYAPLATFGVLGILGVLLGFATAQALAPEGSLAFYVVLALIAGNVVWTGERLLAAARGRTPPRDPGDRA